MEKHISRHPASRGPASTNGTTSTYRYPHKHDQNTAAERPRTALNQRTDATIDCMHDYAACLQKQPHKRNRRHGSPGQCWRGCATGSRMDVAELGHEKKAALSVLLADEVISIHKA